MKKGRRRFRIISTIKELITFFSHVTRNRKNITKKDVLSQIGADNYFFISLTEYLMKTRPESVFYDLDWCHDMCELHREFIENNWKEYSKLSMKNNGFQSIHHFLQILAKDGKEAAIQNLRSQDYTAQSVGKFEFFLYGCYNFYDEVLQLFNPEDKMIRTILELVDGMPNADRFTRYPQAEPGKFIPSFEATIQYRNEKEKFKNDLCHLEDEIQKRIAITIANHYFHLNVEEFEKRLIKQNEEYKKQKETIFSKKEALLWNFIRDSKSANTYSPAKEQQRKIHKLIFSCHDYSFLMYLKYLWNRIQQEVNTPELQNILIEKGIIKSKGNGSYYFMNWFIAQGEELFKQYKKQGHQAIFDYIQTNNIPKEEYQFRFYVDFEHGSAIKFR